MSGNYTDLHTHILPAVDDGAENLESALDLLRWQKNNGICRVALTPHFYPARESLDDFLQRRQQGYSALMSKWDAETMPEVKLGAEVRFSPQLSQLDLRSLTIGDSDYILLELPDAGVPTHVDKVVDILVMQGFIPVLAHVERCSYIRQNPTRLLDLVRKGALAQISTRAFEFRTHRKFAEICLRRGLAHILASDVHCINGKDPSVGETANILDGGQMNRVEEFAKAVWDNVPPPAFSISSVNKGLFGYY